SQPQALIERAKCLAQLGEVNPAVNELRKFTEEPLRNTPVAPVALVHLATLLRGQKNPAEAAAVLAKGRQQYDPALSKDPGRAGWVALLQYHHGVALREAKKFAEARAVLDLVIKQSARPEAAEAALRWGQCLKEEGEEKLEAARKLLASPKKEDAAGGKLREEGLRFVREAVKHLEGHAEQLKQKQPAADVRGRMLYEVAWGYRELAEAEVQAARAALTQELLKKLGPQAAKFGTPDVPPAKVPLQPSAKKARDIY